MSGQLIDLDSDHEHYEIDVVLDGESFKIAVFWDERTDGWYMTLSDGEGVAIASGRRVTVSNLLFGHISASNRPRGQIMAIDTEDEDNDPGRYDLGTRVKVVYFTADEVAEAVAEAAAS